MRIPATTVTAREGATVFTSRTGRVARVVVAVERELHQPPLIIAQREGYMEACFALSELWVDASARPADRLIGTEDEHYEAMDAVHEGRASDLFRCPVDGSLQGVAATRVVPGHPQGFDGGDVITLRCGHTVI